MRHELKYTNINQATSTMTTQKDQSIMTSSINRMTRIRYCTSFLILFLMMWSGGMMGQVSITSFGTPYTENFDGMGATGTVTPTGWFVGTATSSNSTTVIVGTGSSNSGGNYNFGVAGINPIGERALGSLASGGTLRNTEARFTNNTGSAITSFSILYDGEQWRLGQTGSLESGMVLHYSTNGTTYVAMGVSYNFVQPITSGTAGALDGNNSVNRIVGIGGTYTPSSPISNGTTFYLRWVDSDNSGSDAAGAIDNFSITANGTSCTAPLGLTYSTNPATYCQNVAITDNTPSFSNTPTAPVTYSVSPGLPAGLMLNTSTGVISGTPTAATAAADYTVTATNSCGNTSVAVNITVNAAQTWYQDSDNDSYGNSSVTLSACAQPPGYVALDGDCNDNNNAIHPGTQEICNGDIDDDCNGLADDDDPNAIGQTEWYQDIDGDGYGAGAVEMFCTPPTGYINNNTDCDDDNENAYPGATEICGNEIDDDCDGETDESVTYIWNGGAGDWTDPTKWAPYGVPGGCNNAIIGAGTVTLTVNQPIHNLTMTSGSATINGGYNLEINGDLSLTGVIANSGNINIAGSFTFVGGQLSNNGTINVTGLTSLQSGDSKIISSKILNANGGFEHLNSGQLNLGFSAQVVIPTGQTYLANCSNGQEVRVIGVFNALIINHGVFKRTIPGVYRIHNLEIGFQNTGSIESVSGTTLIFQNLNNSGYLGGAGNIQIEGTFTNSGTIAPGTSPGCLTIIGNVTNSTLESELAGTTVCTQYDQLQVTGTFTAAGTLDVVLISPFNPAVNDEFIIVTATGGVSGTFTTINYPTPASEWSIEYNANDITLIYEGSACTASPDYVNLQWWHTPGDSQTAPNALNLCQGSFFTAYGQVYEPGVTEAGGQGAGIEVQFGYGSMNNPNTWTNWVATNFNAQVGNNDEYIYVATLPPGTHYFTFRYRMTSPCIGPWKFGGHPNGEWNGSSQVAGQVTINPLVSYYLDNDNDNFGAGTAVVACSSPGPEYVTVGGDCNDNNANIHPNASEICGNSIDDDCDDLIDESCGSGDAQMFWTLDAGDSDCCTNTICYTLNYSPATTGLLMDYSTGFFIDCEDNMAIVTNETLAGFIDNSYNSDCESGMMLFNSSAWTDEGLPVTAGMTYDLHQVCFMIEPGEEISLTADDVMPPSANINIDGNWTTEFPEFISPILLTHEPFVVTTEASDGSAECDGEDPSANGEYQNWLFEAGGAIATDFCEGSVLFTNNSDAAVWMSSGNTKSIEITFTATNDCEVSVTTTATFTITDDLEPEVGCTETVPHCQNETGEYSVPLLTATDNCGIATITYDITGATTRTGSGPDASGVFNPGLSTVVYTVTDNFGHMVQCTTEVNIYPQPNLFFTLFGEPLLPNSTHELCFDAGAIFLELTDTVATVGTPPFDITFTINGGTPITITDAIPGETDLNLADYIPNEPGDLVAGTYVIQVTSVVDDNGCEIFEDVLNTYYNFTIIINPMPVVDPGTYAAACENSDPIALGGTPSGGIWTGEGVSGNQMDGYTFDPSVGTQILTYTYTDDNTCTGSAEVTITIDDLIVADGGEDKTTCYNVAVTMTPVDPTPGTGVWSGGAGTWSGNQYTPALSEEGTTITVTYTVTNGTCISTDEADIIIEERPTIVTDLPGLFNRCEGTSVTFTVVAEGSGTLHYVWKKDGLPIPSAPDAASYTISSVSPADAGAYSVEVSGNCTPNANSSPASLNVYTQPSFTECPTDITQDNDAGNCSAVVTYTTEVSSLIYTVSGTLPLNYSVSYVFTGATPGSGSGDGSGSTFNEGTTNVVITATNTCGSVTCEFTVTVTDAEAPTITCVSDQTKDVNNAGCTYLVSGTEFDPTFGDNCPDATITNDYNNLGTLDGAIFPYGTTTVLWTVTDGNNNTDTCSFTVTVGTEVIYQLTANGDPVIDGSTLTYCEDDVLTLELTGEAGATYVLKHEGVPVAAGNTNDPAYTFNVALSDAGAYTLVVTSQFGCSDSSSYTLIVNPLPTFTFEVNETIIPDGGNTTVCEGSTVTVEVSDVNETGTYDMYLNDVLLQSGLPFADGAYSFTAALSDEGEYMFVITTASSCTDTFTYTLIVNPLPTITFEVNGDVIADGGSATVCEGSSVTIAVSDVNETGLYDMYLNDVLLQSGLPFADGSYSFTAALTDDGEYRFVITTASGCTDTFTYTLNVNPLPTFTFEVNGDVIPDGGSATVCEGSTVTVAVSDVNETGTYDMYLNDVLLQSGLPFADGAYSFTAALSDEGEYMFVISTASGCIDTFTYTLNVNPLPTFTFEVNGDVIADGGSATVCEGSTVTVEVSDVNETGTYDMYLNDVLLQSGLPFADGSYSFTAALTDDGEYMFVINTASGCTDTFTYTLNVNPLPTFTFEVNGDVIPDGGNATVCEGSTVNVEVSDVNETGLYDMYLNDVLLQSGLPFADGAYSFTAALSDDGEYMFVISTASGCIDTFNYTLNVNPLPTFTFEVNGDVIADGGSATVCEASSVTIAVSDVNETGTYDIYLNDVLLQSGLPFADGGYSFTAALSDDGEYMFVITTASGCTDTFTYTLNVNPLPSFTFEVNGDVIPDGGSATVCEGSTVTVAVSDVNETGTYDMYLNDVLLQTGLPFANGGYSFTAALTDDGEYMFVITTASGCTDTFTYTLNVNPLPTFTFEVNDLIIPDGGSTTVCEGDEVTVEVSGVNETGTYDMFLNDVLLQSGLPFADGSYSFTAALTDDGEYMFVITTASGCTDTFTYTLNVNPLPTFTFEVNGDVIPDGGVATVCEGSTVTVTVSDVNETGIYDMYLNDVLLQSGLPFANGTYSFTASLDDAGNYEFIITTGSTCSDVFEYTLIVNPLPVYTLTVNGNPLADGGTTTHCEGELVTLQLTGDSDDTYTLTGPGGTNAGGNVNDPAVVFPAIEAFEGTYTLTVTTPEGCSKVSTYNVVVNPLPVYTLTVNGTPLSDGDTTTHCEGDDVTLELTGDAGATYILNFEGNPIAAGNVNDPAFIFTAALTDAGEYELVVTSGLNCSHTSTYTMVVNPLPVFALNLNGTPLTDGSTTTLCENEPVTLELTGSNSDDTYTLTGPGGTNVSGNVNDPAVIFPALPLFAGTYTLTVTTEFGCEVISTYDININTLPVFTECQTDTFVQAALCAHEAVVTYDVAVQSLVYSSTGSDPLPFTLTYEFSGATTGSGSGSGSGSTFNAGVTLVTITATNACSSVTCTFEVEVSDQETVVIECSDDIEGVAVNAAGCQAELSVAGPIVSEVCDVNGVEISWTLTGVTIGSGTGAIGTYLFNVGATTVEYIAFDPVSNTSDTCSFTVTVDDPMIVAQASGTTTVNEGAPDPFVTFSASGGTLPYTFTYQVNGGPVQSITTSGGNDFVMIPQSTDNAGVFTYTLISVTDANGCSGTVDPEANEAVITVLSVLNIDIFPSIPSPLNTSFVNGQTRNGYVQINNSGSDASSGTITFRVSKVSNFTLTIPPTLTMSGTTPVHNSSMTITNGPTFYTVTYPASIPAGGNVKLGFTLTATGLVGSQGNMTVTVLDGVGGDINNLNNIQVKSFTIN